MAFVQEPEPRFSFTSTHVTDLDIEALLEMWDDPTSVLGFSLPPSTSKVAPPRPPLEAVNTNLAPTFPRLPRSHSLLNLRSTASGSSSSSFSPTPSPPFPATPPTSAFSPITPVSSRFSKPLPPIFPSPPSSSSLSPSSPYPYGINEEEEETLTDIISLSDLFGPPRANPFPTHERSNSASPLPSSASSVADSRRGSAVSTSSSSSAFSSSGFSSFAFPTPFPHRRASSARDDLVFQSRVERFEAPLPAPQIPSFAPAAPSAFTAPRTAPTPAFPSAAAVAAAGAFSAPPTQLVQQERERERVTAVYPRPRPSRARKDSAGSTGSHEGVSSIGRAFWRRG
ncbi:hypothetical protein JCM8547_005993 [Rhodosporidiobolus lusitaniae]